MERKNYTEWLLDLQNLVTQALGMDINDGTDAPLHQMYLDNKTVEQAYVVWREYAGLNPEKE